MKKILTEELKQIKLEEEEKQYLEQITRKIINSIETKIKKLKINASVFVGGSLAKDTILRKNEYDVDIFVRFSEKYSEHQIKKLFKKIFRFFRIPKEKIKVKTIRGSRDYKKITFRKNKNLSIEVVPTLKISKPEKARNITDLSYFHVTYVKKKLNKKIVDEILLAKSFCHAQRCYGAESYVKGFSGYALELLIIHYKTFNKFLREITKSKDKIIIDSEKQYKNKDEILEQLNKEKTKSPIIFIDPTFKERNVASALSHQTFEKFQKAAKKFLDNPTPEAFEYKKPNLTKMKEKAAELHGIFAVIEIRTTKQPGDIAGTKLLKFAKFFISEAKKSFDIVGGDFEYSGIKNAWIYLVMKRKAEIIIEGPTLNRKLGVEKFKQKHPIWYVEDNKIKSAKKTNITLKEFLKKFKKTHKKTMKQMSIKKIKLC